MMNDTGLSQAITEARLPGAACLIVDRDSVRYRRSFGFADAVAGVPMEADTICQIASMTKALVSVGVMQLVEAGRIELDAPIAPLLPELADPQVLTGFSGDGTPMLRPAAGPITLRHLLTHTSGLGYAFVQPEVLRYFRAAGIPAPGSRASITMPLLFDPGEDWAYGVSTDWAGLAIEAVTGTDLQTYLQTHVFTPLGMVNTAFRDSLPEGAARVHMRSGDGGFVLSPLYLGGGEFHGGGGGLTSTAADYARFLQMMLRGGELDGHHLLQPETVAEMCRNQVGAIRAGAMPTAMPDFAAPYDTFPDQHTGWGLGFLINPEAIEGGRSAGSLCWAGIFNSYYWIDPAAGVAGVFMSQLAPFGDPGALAAFGALERMAYR
ncbi:serine hydrolase domain-containing protein [Allopontixanthobacter sp.]|uniref:serine hydrolase domain-containing protein n=1 Tax=Allopontixanthobacter sp. TaxID=2906452 RepID=UPI002ABA7E06|nr:serine hydrolase domain-containing protein [Allopontixanthobacter sp.]MDZ4306800.1 serine hydrolase domain-containing protein [Allopontixanthobacter sp.]